MSADSSELESVLSLLAPLSSNELSTTLRNALLSRRGDAPDALGDRMIYVLTRCEPHPTGRALVEVLAGGGEDELALAKRWNCPLCNVAVRGAAGRAACPACSPIESDTEAVGPLASRVRDLVFLASDEQVARLFRDLNLQRSASAPRGVRYCAAEARVHAPYGDNPQTTDLILLAPAIDWWPWMEEIQRAGEIGRCGSCEVDIQCTAQLAACPSCSAEVECS